MSLLLFSNCKQTEKLDDCSLVDCLQPSITLKLKFVDNNSNQDLIFGSNSKFKSSQIQLYSSRFNKNLEFQIDSLDKNQKFVTFKTGVSDEININLSGSNINKLKIETKFTKQDCCGSLSITNLTLNGLNIPFNPMESNTLNINFTSIIIKI